LTALLEEVGILLFTIIFICFLTDVYAPV
jgi:hypothetical protein